jgi:hypothetical protein
MKLSRREFAAVLAAPALLRAADDSAVEVTVNSADPRTADASVTWAVEQLKAALGSRLAPGIRPSVRIVIGAPQIPTPIQVPARIPGGNEPADPVIPKIRPEPAELSVIAAPRANGLESSRLDIPTFNLHGGDAAGLKYAILEMADRVRHGSDWPEAQTEVPFLPVRGNMRLFSSELEDKPWFYDREMWPEYFAMLAANRFNRFHLAFSIGYDFLREVTDSYFLFPYPFFLTDVPGYKVRARNLPDSEPAKNLETLRYISDQCAGHGIHFQLGLWMHGYEYANSPKATYTIDGLNAENHGPYCRDALTQLLKACPNVNGVTLRIHGESGVTEGSYDFWKTVFDGAVRSGRRLQLDLHAKGIDDQMIGNALATGLPVQISPKFWAEHMGLPYLQSSIRELEMPKAENAKGLMALSTGTRSFTRYSYADLFRADRKYQVLHRIWPGTQRLLLWGDPEFAAAYARAFSVAGSDGVEIMEPLSFKGRRGSGLPGGRNAYADASLKPRWDWEKYRYAYRVWGRLLFNPKSDPDTWRRELRTSFAANAGAAETALSSASRILPLITAVHSPSAANNTYWPEIYTNQPIVDPRRKNPYGDTPSPKTFGNASSFDPEMFLSVNAFAEELLSGKRSAKYSPVEVASWLEMLSANADGPLPRNPPGATADYRRLTIDVQVQAHLGRFFAHKFRAGVYYAIHEKTKGRGSLEAALSAYRQARDRWSQICELTRNVYLPDITVGELECLRGHWVDRLPSIDGDLADMQARMAAAVAGQTPAEHAAILAIAASPAPRATPNWHHSPPPRFKPNAALAFEIAAAVAPTFHYRHLDQGERWQSMPMTRTTAGHYRAEIPADYTNSPFHLQYYFSAVDPDPTLFPGLGPNLSGQPYFILEQHA